MTIRERAPAFAERRAALRGRLPLTSIVGDPTPVERLRALEEATHSPVPLWIKRDDRSAHPYGGNKPRKLEFLLGRCLARGTNRIVTVGGLGSNHCLATTIYAREVGVTVDACLVDQPLTGTARRTLAAMASAGARIHWVETGRRAPWTMVGLLARGTLSPGGARPALIRPGGSTPLGTVGMVDAALELAGQIESGEAPEPAAIFVALGSGGTHAGLVAGLRLAGLDVPVVGVRVSDLVRLDARTVAGLATRTLRLVARAAPSIPRTVVRPAEVRVLAGFLGPGYGHPTPAAGDAIRLLDETEGIALEETYTGKAMAAMLESAQTRRFEGPLLFWHTYNTHPLPAPVPEWEARLPAALRQRLEAAR